MRCKCFKINNVSLTQGWWRLKLRARKFWNSPRTLNDDLKKHSRVPSRHTGIWRRRPLRLSPKPTLHIPRTMMSTENLEYWKWNLDNYGTDYEAMNNQVPRMLALSQPSLSRPPKVLRRLPHGGEALQLQFRLAQLPRQSTGRFLITSRAELDRRKLSWSWPGCKQSTSSFQVSHGYRTSQQWRQSFGTDGSDAECSTGPMGSSTCRRRISPGQSSEPNVDSLGWTKGTSADCTCPAGADDQPMERCSTTESRISSTPCKLGS